MIFQHNDDVFDFIFSTQQKDFQLSEIAQKTFDQWVKNNELVKLSPYPFTIKHMGFGIFFAFILLVVSLSLESFSIFLGAILIFVLFFLIIMLLELGELGVLGKYNDVMERFRGKNIQVLNENIITFQHTLPQYIMSSRENLITLLQHEKLSKKLFYISQLERCHPLLGTLSNEFAEEVRLSGIGKKSLISSNKALLQSLSNHRETETDAIHESYYTLLDNMSYAEQLQCNTHLSAYLAEYMKTQDTQSLRDNLGILFHSNQVLTQESS